MAQDEIDRIQEDLKTCDDPVILAGYLTKLAGNGFWAIKIRNSGYTLIDSEDYPKIKNFNWRLGTRGYIMFAKRINSKKMKNTYLHHFLLDIPNDIMIDHINHNILDNRKCNLRVVTKTQNGQNKSKAKNSNSYYLGVHKKGEYARCKDWIVQVKVNNKTSLVGSFDNERHAAMARDIAVKDLYGEYANLNFPYAIHGHPLNN